MSTVEYSGIHQNTMAGNVFMNSKHENRTSLQILHFLVLALLFHKVHKYKSLVNIHQNHNEQVKYCKQKYSGILRLTVSLFA